MYYKFFPIFFIRSGKEIESFYLKNCNRAKGLSHFLHNVTGLV